MPVLYPAIFLDRDGVIIENRVDHVRRWQDVAFIPGVVEAIASLRSLPYRVVIATNQSAVGRGLVDLRTVDRINQRIVATIAEFGGHVDGVYVCPHTPDDGCDCRKPRPGLLLRAARELSLDLSRSVMIGDAITDAQAGLAAGVHSLMVLTGRGTEHAEMRMANGLGHLETFPDLAAAIDWLRASPRSKSA